MRKLTLYLAAAGLLLSGCKQYLEVAPTKQTIIQTADQLEALMNTAVPTAWEPNRTAIFSSDDFDVSRTLYSQNPASVRLTDLNYYTFGTDQIAGEAADVFWNGEYAKIYTANLVLESLDKVTGPDAQKAALRADAYFMRAYSLWVLANTYCLPYSPANLGEPGLPLKTSTVFEESLVRASLRATYAQIEQDLQAALATVPADDVQDRLRWRSSRKAIAAFMSRYYLFTGDYAKASAMADEALASKTVQLYDYKTLAAGTSVTYTNPAATLSYSVWNTWTAINFMYYQELYYARFLRHAGQWFIPSPGLLAQYEGTNDLRYKWLFIPNGGRRMGVATPATFRYTVYSDGTYLPSAPTRAEVLLNKAEVLARQGDAAGALALANTLRQSRLQAYSALTASSAAEALTKVLAERRRELPFTMRWYDIRRFSTTATTADDVVVARDFFPVSAAGVDLTQPQTYTLPVGSRRYAAPINGVEINSARGQLTQNNY